MMDRKTRWLKASAKLDKAVDEGAPAGVIEQLRQEEQQCRDEYEETRDEPERGAE